jgi:TIR domain
VAVASDLPAQIHDVFICHASEDKEDFVRPLAHALRERHLDVWYDEFVLHVGDSLRATIDRGLASCRFGVVVLSPSFFTKAWAQRELNGLVARETAEGRPVVLPVWHGLGRDDILRHSPPLADAVAISSNAGLDHVVQGLLRGSDLIQALLLLRVTFCSKKEFLHRVSQTSFGSALSVSKTVKFRHPSHTFRIGCSLCHLKRRIRADSLASTLRGRRSSLIGFMMLTIKRFVS